jgi:hypothetical protein
VIKLWASHWRAVAAILAFLAVGLWNLGGPPMWWDEGWTLSLARNVVERGSYARLLDGNLAANGMEAAVPVTELVALSFRLFGVGVWQGRLPGVLSTVVALGLLFVLTRRMFDQRVAWSAMGVALLLAAHPQINALIQGRQVLAELPMFAVLLGGVLCADQSARRQYWLILPAIGLLALALIMKAQTLPFFVIGMCVGMGVALLLRRWRYAATLAICLIISYLLLSPMQVFFNWLANPPLHPKAVTGLVEIIAFVTEPGNRVFALVLFLTFGLPSALGLLDGIWQCWQARHTNLEADGIVLRMTMIGMSGSWLAWFVLLSVGAPRYMFMPVFFATPFLAMLLDRLTNRYDVFGMLQRMTSPLRERRFSRDSGSVWLAVLILVVTLPLSMVNLTRYYLLYSDDAAQQTAAYFNTQSAPDTRIETYESELHFLLNRNYHWPPDQTHVELNKRSLLGWKTTVDYDPLAADPEYLVVGIYARENGLYKPVIAAGHFRLLQQIGVYDLYVRVRN